MSRSFQTLICLSVLVPFVIAFAGSARAVPVDGTYIEDPRCDFHPNQSLPHEIGEFTFPIDERISSVVTTFQPICVGDDGIANDWLVEIRNLTPFPYINLFFVADRGGSVGNADGTVLDAADPLGIRTDAFRIDGTVTVTGVNDNLRFESIAVNEIFEPGERWQFVVANFFVPAGAPATPLFDSPGGFAGTSSGFPPSNASILATQVPEPSVALLLGLGLSGLAFLRRRDATR
jgi:hypothetical protein